MNTIVITANKDISLDDLRRALRLHWPLLRTPTDRIAVEERNSRVYIYHPRRQSGETDSRQIFLDYSWTDLAKRVIQVIGDDPELIIDNDCGTALPGDQFVARLRSNKDWEWRVQNSSER